MAKKNVLQVLDTDISIIQLQNNQFISLTDIARYKSKGKSDDVIKNGLNLLTFNVQRIPQRIPQHIKCQHRQHNGNTGNECQEWSVGDYEIVIFFNHQTPRRGGWLNTNP